MMFGNFARKLAGLFRGKSKAAPHQVKPSSGGAPITVNQLAAEAGANGTARDWAPNPSSWSIGSRPTKFRPEHARHRRNTKRPNVRNPRGRVARQGR